MDYRVRWYRNADGAAVRALTQSLVPLLPLPEDADRLVVPLTLKRIVRWRLARTRGALCYERAAD